MSERKKDVTAAKRQADRKKKLLDEGLVRYAVFVPADRTDDIRILAERLTREHRERRAQTSA